MYQMQSLLGAVDRGIQYGQNVATADAQAGATVNIPNAAQAAAVSYVVNKMPGTLKSLGMDPSHVADLVISKLPMFASTMARAEGFRDFPSLAGSEGESQWQLPDLAYIFCVAASRARRNLDA